MAPHVEHAAFKHREQTDRSGADYRDIAAVGSVLHRPTLTPEDAILRRAVRKQILRLLASQIYKLWVMIAIDLPDEAATAALAARLAALARAGDVIALRGELGAGKTSFARAFIRARGGGGEVPSPTFTLVQVYELGGAAIWHFDGYRLRDPDEAWELGIEDAFADGISLIEWPERFGPLVPARRLEIMLSPGASPAARLAKIDAAENWASRLADLAVGT
jgi:tRNA threonylcarbamoyladenosine biosynthesis protein TsaE